MTLPNARPTAQLPPGPEGDAAARLLAALGVEVERCSAPGPLHLANGPVAAIASLPDPQRGDLTLAAECGALLLTGEPGRPPIWPPAPVCRSLLGLAAALGVLAAGRSGGRVTLDARALLVYLFGAARRFRATGVAPVRAGARDPGAGPDSPYPDTTLPCADGYVHVHYAPADPSLLWVLLGDGAAAAGGGPTRRDAAVVDRRLSRWLVHRSRAEAAAAAQELRHPWAGVTTIDELRRRGDLRLPRAARRLAMCRGPRPAPSERGQAPLCGLRVLEVSLAAAAPMAGQLLASLGADVVRLVHPAAAPGWYDAGKRIVRADFGTPEGRALLAARLQQADLLLTNLSPRSLRNLGLDYRHAASLRPGLAMVSIPAYPLGDPRHLWGAFDPAIQAAVGLADATRYPGGPPLRVGGHPVDAATALAAAAAAVVAWQQQAATGCGAHWEVPMLGAGALLAAPLWTAPAIPEAPVAVYRTAGDDAWVAVAGRVAPAPGPATAAADGAPAPGVAAATVARWAARRPAAAAAAGLRAVGWDAEALASTEALAAQGLGMAAGLNFES